ncbi:dihydrolipoamide acetyltransferase family protein [Clostridium sp. HV4-5-A1G]|uniref:dihydrolipoamide acetyltransferase family protein n=1 Tax=Clostridium sp. HV4-5-A1G TaxID=2004595 RepID=UPI00123B967D|nr:dihydrolipoamide acetyltransferase family protein [Clostridium sp. HV4-5-A1G]KAA8679080.1 2-oxo acid dehydrogenase subunit E2 [Clostridium sp. HV4-5-A1G]
MAEVIIMPKLGFNMDEGELVKWNKNVGESVKKGEILFEINTDKTTMPVEATLDGVLLKILVEEGEFVPVFTPIAVVGNEGEDADAVLAAYLKEKGGEDVKSADEKSVVAKASEVTASVGLKELKLSPKAKKYVEDKDIDPDSLKEIKGTGFEGGLTAKDIKVSPLARKLADKNKVNLAAVEGTGINGKIMKADVEKDINNTSEVSTEAGGKKILKEIPYKGVRKVIGEKLSQSKFTSPHLYFTDYVDTTKLTALRKELNEVSEEKISVSDLLVLAASKALQKYPDINSSLVDGKIIYYRSTNVGIAVAGDNGLIVPCVKNVQEKTLTVIARETKDLIARARAGKLSVDEYTGGTFSISNLGMFGINNFTAIINPPETAILSVSSVRKKAVVITEDDEDKIIIRPIMNIQLSIDHRIIDGLLASQFVEYVKELLENPIKILM